MIQCFSSRKIRIFLMFGYYQTILEYGAEVFPGTAKCTVSSSVPEQTQTQKTVPKQ